MDINKWLVLREIHKPLFMGISRIYSEIKGEIHLQIEDIIDLVAESSESWGSIIVCFVPLPQSSPLKRESPPPFLVRDHVGRQEAYRHWAR